MRQFIGSIRDTTTVRDLLFSLSPPRLRDAVAAVDRLELELMSDDTEPIQLAYAQALADYADAGGYLAEVTFDTCCVAALGVGFERVKWRELSTLSGGEQKRLALEALLRGPDEVLLLDEPDNYLDVPGKRWLEAAAAGHAEDGAAGQPRPRAAGRGGDGRSPRWSSEPWATRSGCTAAGSPPSAPPGRTGSPASPSCAAAGTSSTRS